ncbi:MAG: hypothetical protein JXA90_09045 [Planctomycetes bacterium]|nr:hypothetical protein [Planctomycetota bacterium]
MATSQTSWQPGRSPNPGGRPRVVGLVREMAQADTPEAYERVRSAMREAERETVRLAAALAILRMAGIPMGSTSSDGESLLPTMPQPQPPSPIPTSSLLTLVKLPSPSSGGAGS